MRTAVSCWVDKRAKINKFFHYCNLQAPALGLWLSMARPTCCPEFGLLSSASSPQAPEKQPLLPSSPVQVQGVQVARQEERHCQQSPDLKKELATATKYLCEIIALNMVGVLYVHCQWTESYWYSCLRDGRSFSTLGRLAKGNAKFLCILCLCYILVLCTWYLYSLLLLMFHYYYYCECYLYILPYIQGEQLLHCQVLRPNLFGLVHSDIMHRESKKLLCCFLW